MLRRYVRNALVVAAVAGGGWACETGTEPPESTFDADAALADHEAWDSILASNAMDAFRAMAGGVTFQSLAPEVELAGEVASLLPLLTRAGEEAKTLPGLAPDQGFPGVPARNPIISSFRRGGRTFQTMSIAMSPPRENPEKYLSLKF